MNVLFYIPRYPGYGGIENVTTVLANWLIDKIDSITIYSFDSQDKNILLKNLSPKVEFIEAQCHHNYTDLSNINQLRDIIFKKKINRIIFQDSYAPVEDCLIKGIQGIPDIKLYIVEHNSPLCFLKLLKYKRIDNFYHKWKTKIFYPLYYLKIFNQIKKRHKLLYSICNKYILLSDTFKKEFYKLVPEAQKDHKIQSITNPITITKNNNRLPQKEKICLFCGRLVSQKGIQYLIKIWKLVENKNKSWKLIIVGDGPERQFIENSIRKYGLKRIELVGYKDNVRPYYEKASILCMTSTFEGFGLVLVESMLFGCIPILFNSFASASDIINSGKNGFLIPPFHVKEYTNKLLNLMESPELIKEINNNVIHSIEKFNLDLIGEQWINLLNE